MKKNPFIVTYDDLIREAERELSNMLLSYPQRVKNGEMTAWLKSHRIEAKEVLIKMFKKARREKQADLFEVYNQVKAK